MNQNILRRLAWGMDYTSACAYLQPLQNVSSDLTGWEQRLLLLPDGEEHVIALENKEGHLEVLITAEPPNRGPIYVYVGGLRL